MGQNRWSIVGACCALAIAFLAPIVRADPAATQPSALTTQPTTRKAPLVTLPPPGVAPKRMGISEGQASADRVISAIPKNILPETNDGWTNVKARVATDAINKNAINKSFSLVTRVGNIERIGLGWEIHANLKSSGGLDVEVVAMFPKEAQTRLAILEPKDLIAIRGQVAERCDVQNFGKRWVIRINLDNCTFNKVDVKKEPPATTPAGVVAFSPVGRWRLIDAPDVWNFLADGTFARPQADQPIRRGTWRIEANQLIIVYPDDGGRTSSWRIDNNSQMVRTVGGGAATLRREMQKASGPDANIFDGAAAPAPAPAEQSKPVDVLALAAAKFTALWGKWNFEAGDLNCTQSGRALLPYSPPEEYDLTVTFTRNSGNDSLFIMFPLAKGSLIWSIGGYHGFCSLKPDNHAKPISDQTDKVVLTNNEPHTCVIRVRKTGVQAFFDGKLDSELATDGTGYDTDTLKIDGKRVIGFHTQGTATFSQVTVTGVAVPATNPAAANAPNAGGVISIGTLESKRPPVLTSREGLVVFEAPRHDRWWVGSNGVFLRAAATWEQTGTVWVCGKYSPRPWGMKFIHPFSDGHVLVNVADKGIDLRGGGTWSGKENVIAVNVSPEFVSAFPLDPEVAHPVRSELSATGAYKLFIDNKLAATAQVANVQPLSLSDQFVGDGVPQTLDKGQAGVIIENSYRRTSVAEDLSFTPGDRTTAPKAPVVKVAEPRVADALPTRLTIVAHIDGSDDVVISRQGATWKHLGAKWPTGVFMNGVAWAPSKNATTLTNKGTTTFLNGPVDLGSARIVEQTGRTKVTLDASADEITVHFKDGKAGAADFVVQIEFRTQGDAKRPVAGVPAVAAADDPNLKALNDRLNKIDNWTVKNGTWSPMPSGGMRGEGDSTLDFNEPLPSDFTLSFTMNVVNGMRPRIHFIGPSFFIGNEGFSKQITLHGAVTDVAGNAVPYRNGQELAVSLTVSGTSCTLRIGDETIQGTCKQAETTRLRIRGGDGFSKGTTEYSNFRITATNVAPPAAGDANAAPPPPAMTLPPGATIVSARWGGGKNWVDCTDRVKANFAQGVDFRVQNKMLGPDPTPHWKKHLIITYELGGARRNRSIAEGAFVRLGKSGPAIAGPPAAAPPTGNPPIGPAPAGPPTVAEPPMDEPELPDNPDDIAAAKARAKATGRVPTTMGTDLFDFGDDPPAAPAPAPAGK